MSVNTEVYVSSGAVEALLLRLEDTLRPAHMAEFLGYNITPYIQGRVQRRFEMEGDDVSGPWAPLADATVRMREDAGFPGEHPINVRTGELERYISDSTPALVAEPYAMLIYPGRDPGGEMGAKMRTAQSGSDNPSAPARPVIGLDEADLTYVLTAVALEISLGMQV